MSFSGEKALDVVRGLTVDVGERFAGKPGEKEGAEYLLQQFKSFGYDAELQPFPIDLYEVSGVSLTVDGLGEVPCKGLLGSSDCPGGVEGELRYVETGEEPYLTPDCKGKVLMITGELGGPKFKAIVDAQPAAVIVLEATPYVNPRRHNISHERKYRFGSVPAVRVRYEDAERLMACRGAKARVAIHSVYTESTAYNVIAELKGSEKPDEIIAICGHADSIYESAGTLDNAAGTAIVVELARVFKEIGSKRTLRFIAFSGEEQGLRGSVYYARELRKADKAAKKDPDFVPSGKETELDRHRLVVNIDVQGALLASNSAFITGPLDLGAAVRLLAAEEGPFFRVAEQCYSSDNAPLSDAGVPAISFGRAGAANFYGHTDGDRYELCSAEGLAISGKFIERWLQRYVTEPRMLPFERTIPDDHKKKVEAYFKERFMLRLDEGIE